MHLSFLLLVGFGPLGATAGNSGQPVYILLCFLSCAEIHRSCGSTSVTGLPGWDHFFLLCSFKPRSSEAYLLLLVPQLPSPVHHNKRSHLLQLRSDTAK